MINYVKLLKICLIELIYLLFLSTLSGSISIHPMGRYTTQGISHISTVQPQYVPWTNPPLPSKQYVHRNPRHHSNVEENAGSFSDIFGENRRRTEIQV